MYLWNFERAMSLKMFIFANIENYLYSIGTNILSNNIRYVNYNNKYISIIRFIIKNNIIFVLSKTITY